MPNVTLTHRERLLRTLRREPVERLPDYEFSVWPSTIERWRTEGLEPRYETRDTFCGPFERNVLDTTFETDSAEFELPSGLGVLPGLCPPFEQKVVEERGDIQIYQDAYGGLVERLRPELGETIPRGLRRAIESRADWERIRDERLDPDHPDRIPFDLEQAGAIFAAATTPVILRGISLFGWLRCWMGLERISLVLYDDPAWIEEMMEHLACVFMSVLERLAGKVKVDVCAWWEDMCYKSGPLISPKMFNRLMLPRYKRLTDFLQRELGCAWNWVDCDGNVHALVPGWLEGGINIMFPAEPPHTDALRLFRDYGDRLCIRGAFDKKALIAGPEAIERESEKLQPLFDAGGFIPHLDHFVPMDVSLENYLYYRRRKCEIIGKAWREVAGLPGAS